MQVPVDVAQHVDRVLGGRELRRVGQFEVGQLAGGDAARDRRGDHVDALVDAVLAHALGTEDGVRVGIDQQLEAHRGAARVVARVIGRVRMDDPHGSTRSPQPLLVPAGGRDLQSEDAHDGRAQHRTVGSHASHDHVGDHASLTVGRVGERHEGRIRHQRVALHNGVADGVDRRIGRPHLLVDQDSAAQPGLQTCDGRQRRLRTHADGRDHEVGGQHVAVGEGDGVGTDLGHARPEAQVDTVLAQACVNLGDHLGVERGHDLVERLDEGDLDAAVAQVLGHLDADETAADHHGRPGVGRGRHHRVCVLDVAQAQCALDARDRRTHGNCPGREDERVVGKLRRLTRCEIAHRDDLALAVDGRCLGVDADVQPEAGTEGRGRLQQQRGALLDQAPHVVRQAAVGERHVSAALEDNDGGRFVQPAEARCG